MKERRGMMIEGKMIAKIDRVLAFCNVYPKSHPSAWYSLKAATYMPYSHLHDCVRQRPSLTILSVVEHPESFLPESV